MDDAMLVLARFDVPVSSFLIFLLLSGFPASLWSQGLSPISASIDVSVTTAKAVRIPHGFAGFNVALMDTAIQWDNPALVSSAAKLNPGWLRYPAGTRSDAFNWETGRSRPEWVRQFAGSAFFPQIEDALEALDAKGGERIEEANALARKVGARGLIVCVNVFTDTPESARGFAAYAKRKGISVLAWQLGNEPTFFPQFFANATDYADKMRPFADAIRSSDSSALISLSLGLLGRDSEWDNLLARYPRRYWDVLTYHHYPRVRGSDGEMMAALNQVLLDETTEYVKGHIVPLFGSMPVIITEAAPGAPIAVGLQNQPGTTMVGTLYGGLWAAEYVLRLSFLPQVQHVGMHQLLGQAAVDLDDPHHTELLAAYKQGKQVDASSLDYRLFESAQGTAYALATQAINSAQLGYATVVTGGGTVSGSNGIRNIPAVYAQAYRGRANWSLVVVNKGAQHLTAAVRINGRSVRSPVKTITVTGLPSARNTPASKDVSPKTGTEIRGDDSHPRVLCGPCNVVNTPYWRSRTSNALFSSA